MAARHRERDGQRSGRRGQVQLAAEAVRNEVAAHLRLVVEAEAQLPAVARKLAPDVRLRVVGIEHGDAAGCQANVDLALGQRHVLHRAESFEVRALRVVHQRHGRRREARQVVDLAGVVHAHLDHCRMMLRTQLEQGQRQSDVVVQVALGRQHTLGRAAEMCAQDRRAHFLDRGLAVAAGDAQERNRETAAPGGGELAQREARVIHRDQRQAGVGLGPDACDHGAGGPLGQHLAHVVVAVEALALQCDEQHAGDHGARIGADGVEFRVGALVHHAERSAGF